MPLFLADGFTPREEVAGDRILRGVTADRRLSFAYIARLIADDYFLTLNVSPAVLLCFFYAFKTSV